MLFFIKYFNFLNSLYLNSLHWTVGQADVTSFSDFQKLISC